MDRSKPPTQRRNRRGIALATTLIFLVVLFVGATALGTISINNLTLRKISSNSVVAMQAAEAGLAMVQAKLNATPGYGTNGESMSGSLSASGASWFVQFSTSSSPGPTDSVNNLNGTTKITRSDGTQVPPYSIDVIISTNVASPNRNIPKVGCLLSNIWKNAIATTGTITSTSSLQVYGVSNLTAAQNIMNDPTNALSYQDLATGGALAANSAANPSVSLGSGSYYTTLTTPGTVSVPSTLPAPTPNTVPVPSFTWSFPTYTGSTMAKVNGNSLGTQLTRGTKDIFYVQGDVSMSNITINNCTLCVNGNATFSGTLTLINANLYVNGNLVVNGGIREQSNSAADCTGSIYVCGSGHTTTINGSSTIATNPIGGSGGAYDKPAVAIFSQGDVQMNGQMAIEGVVYSDGNINVSGGATVVGLAIANGNASTAVNSSGTFIYCAPYAAQFSQQLRLSMNKLSFRIIDTM